MHSQGGELQGLSKPPDALWRDEAIADEVRLVARYDEAKREARREARHEVQLSRDRRVSW